MFNKPLCVDLYAGLGGWAQGFLAEGYEVIGFDIERHDYSTGGYPADLVLQDVRTLHGSQFKDAAVIVASSPCQAYSYMAMPWSRAKAMAADIRNDFWKWYDLNELFVQPFRIALEAGVPLVVENVCGAQPWVGRAKWHYGSFYLWGDVPALMPMTCGRMKYPVSAGPRLWRDREIPRLNDGESSLAHRGEKHIPHIPADHWTNPSENGTKVSLTGRAWYAEGLGKVASHSHARKAASAQIAKIPFPLARHIAKCFKGES